MSGNAFRIQDYCRSQRFPPPFVTNSQVRQHERPPLFAHERHKLAVRDLRTGQAQAAPFRSGSAHTAASNTCCGAAIGWVADWPPRSPRGPSPSPPHRSESLNRTRARGTRTPHPRPQQPRNSLPHIRFRNHGAVPRRNIMRKISAATPAEAYTRRARWASFEPFRNEMNCAAAVSVSK